MKTKLMSVLLLGCLTVIVSGFACNGSQYQKAAAFAKDFAASVNAFQDSEIALHDAGKVSDAEHKAIQNELIKIATAGEAMDAAIRTQQSAVGAKIAVDAASQTIQDVLKSGVLHVKDPNTATELQLAVQAMQALIDNILVITGRP